MPRGREAGRPQQTTKIAQPLTEKAFGLTVPGELSLNGIRRFAASAYDRLWHTAPIRGRLHLGRFRGQSGSRPEGKARDSVEDDPKLTCGRYLPGIRRSKALRAG